jgi:hypothetical protein
MSEEKTRRWIYNQEEIFQDIEGDPDNVNMTIPPEVAEAVGIVPGDTIKISIGDQGTMIIEKVTLDKKETHGEE